MQKPISGGQKPAKLLPPQQMPPQPQPPFRLGVPVRLRDQRIHRVIQPAAQKLDVRAPIAVQEVLDVHHVAERLPHARVFELLEQRARKAQVQPRHILVALQHPRRPVVAPQNLPGLPALARIVQRHQVSQRLVHVQPQRMINFRHKECL